MGSKAVSQGFKVIKDNPQLKEALKRELADTLAKGWEATTKQYPIFKALEPMRIVQSEKGRVAQAGHIIDKTFLEQSIKVLRDNVESMPKELSKEEFLTKGLERVINKERFLEHLQKAKDSKQRLAFLNLVEPTMAKANIELDILTDSGELRKGYLKAFEYGENRDLFYLLVTQDKDKLLISGYPISKEKEIKRILKKAKSITFKEGVAFEEITNRPELNKSSTLKADSTIDSKLLSKQGIDEVSLVKVQSKFKYDEKKASDLLEWHKDSSPITKDKDGLPKVFYHGSSMDKDIEIFEPLKHSMSHQGLDILKGVYFSDKKGVAKTYIRYGGGMFESFLKLKNPYVIDFKGGSFNAGIDNAVSELGDIKNFKEQYDGIVFKNIRDSNSQRGQGGYLGDTIIVFDSKQIKHIDNKGSYTDINGNITSTKPKDTQAEHRYFNEDSPNIYQSNPHIGAGLVSGTLAGVETDENGNIIGFDPSKFALGFLGGSATSLAVSKIYKHKTAQKYALNSIKSIQENYKELSENNPLLFAKILSNMKERDFLKSKKEVKALSEEVFNKELKAKIQESIAKEEIKLMPQSEFKNYEDFKSLFDEIRGNKGMIKTPYKDVEVDIKYAFIHFKKNTYNTNRDNIKGGFFATFKNPLFVVEQLREGSNKPSVYFYKPFYDENKKLLNLFGISVDSKGKLDFKTYYLDSNNRRLDILLNRKDLTIRYIKE